MSNLAGLLIEFSQINNIKFCGEYIANPYAVQEQIAICRFFFPRAETRCEAFSFATGNGTARFSLKINELVPNASLMSLWLSSHLDDRKIDAAF